MDQLKYGMDFRSGCCDDFFSHGYLPVIKHGVLENTLFIGGVPIETLI